MYRNVSIRPIGQSDHQSINNRKRTFAAQAISEIPELSHGIQDRRPRHSKHPSLLAMPTAFSVHFLQVNGPVPRTYSCNALTGVKARRWRVGDLSPRYWAGEPSDTDGGRAPYAAVLICDPSWSSKLVHCLTRQYKRICAKAEMSQRRVSK